MNGMARTVETDVLVVGGGPVGLTLALVLARSGTQVTVAEMRHPAEAPSVKCNHVAARSMEIFRRLGVAARLRDAGLPADYPNDMAYRTTMVGMELARIPIPCRRDRYRSRVGPDTLWPTPEPPHRINQIFLEPILFEHAASTPRLTILSRTCFDQFSQDDTGVTALAHNLDGGEPCRVVARYLVGCDGGRSEVRRQIGARLSGEAVVQRVQSTYIRAPELLSLVRESGLGELLPRSASQRQRLRHRRPGNLAGPQLPQTGRRRLRCGGSRLGHPHHPRRRP